MLTLPPDRAEPFSPRENGDSPQRILRSEERPNSDLRIPERESPILAPRESEGSPSSLPADPKWRRLRRRPLGRYRYVRLRWRVLFAVVDFVGALAFGSLRRLRALVARVASGRRPEVSEHPKDPRTILLVQLDHLGDAVISTVMLPLLRRRYPRASIEVLAGPWNRELFEAMPEVSRVHVSRINRFARRGRIAWVAATFWWGWRLRRRKADLAIDVRGEFPLALVLWLSGARRRLGWDCGGGGFLLTDSPELEPGRPEAESRLALLAELEIRPHDKGENPYPAFRPPDQARRSVARQLEDLPGDDASGGPLLVFHVGAGTRPKRWPTEHWRALVARETAGLAARVVLVGDESDRTVARAILGRQPPAGTADWTGRLGLLELAALLEQADVAVGADSGPAHLAAAVGTAAVVLFSGTNDPRQWQPRGKRVCVLRQPVECSPCHRHECPRRDHACMRRIFPARVAEAIERTYRSVELPIDATHASPIPASMQHSARPNRRLMQPAPKGGRW